MKLLIAGGGTGGHVLAGVAIAEAWKAQFPEAEILFVGAKGGLEEKLVPRANLKLKLLNIGSLNRVGIFRKLTTLIQLPWAMVHSFWIVFRFRPNATIGVGGYASGPLVLAAVLLASFLKIKTAILEQNSVSGLTNRMLGKFVRTVFGCFNEISRQFPAQKVVLVGNPVRSILSELPPTRLDSGQPLKILAFGGSQGAVGMNTRILEAAMELGEKDIEWMHQTGPKDLDRVRHGHIGAGSKAQVLPFIDDMKAAYSWANLVICRAGSSTLSELAAVGRAAILVPLPTAADDHQRKNAQVYVDAGAARLFDQEQMNGHILAKLILEMIANPRYLEEMERNVRKLHRPNAAQAIVKTLISVK